MAAVFDLWSIRSTVALCLTGLLLLLVLSTARSYLRLRHIRGPWLSCVSELWLLRATAKGDLYKDLEKVLRTYGSPARIGPKMIVTDDPEVVRLMTAPRSPFRRGHWYAGMKFDPRINNLLSEQDEKRHAELRAKMMPAYTGKEVPDLESNINERVLDLIKLIEREAVDRSRSIDFARIAQYFTLDSLTHIAFGYPFGFLTQNKDLYDYIKETSNFFPVMELGTNVPFIHTILSSSFAQALAGPKPEDKTGLGKMAGVAQKVVAERFDPTSEKKHENDMLDSFVKHGLTQLEAESESLLQILAGSDSTATTIRATMLFLLTNPIAYMRLRAEIDEAVANGRISYPVVKNQEALELPYLQGCIKEGLRLWQPLNGIQTKVTPPEGAVISGVRVPGRTQVGQNHHNMMRREDIWGKTGDVFIPERWLSDSETTKALEKVWELSFAYGRFTCLGKGIALMELNKVFVELLRRFDFGLVHPVNTVTTSHVQSDMDLNVWTRKT